MQFFGQKWEFVFLPAPLRASAVEFFMKMIRSILSSVVEGAIKRFSGSGRANETITDREYLQHYGFTSVPLPGAEGIIVNEGNHIILIASDDRRYRLALSPGAVALYTDEGDYVLLGRDRNITVLGGTSVTVQTPNLQVTGMNGAPTNMSVTGDAAFTGNMAITGNLAVTGNITATGTITPGA
jgi:phage baseplate assembly protein V